jgi:hypothetical protein
MPQSYKVLGQVYPGTNTESNLYSVPASTSAVVSTINVCNQASSATTFRIAVRPAGATLEAKHFLSYDTTIPANDSISLTLGITLATTDVITVRSTSGSVSFSAFGTEIV